MARVPRWRNSAVNKEDEPQDLSGHSKVDLCFCDCRACRPCWGGPDSLRHVGVFHGRTVCLPHLLHVAQHVLPAVEDALPLLRVQVEDEVSGVVLIALLVPAGETAAWAGAGPSLPRPSPGSVGSAPPVPSPPAAGSPARHPDSAGGASQGRSLTRPGAWPGMRYLNTRPLFTVVFIFCTRCSTFTWKWNGKS